MAEQVIVVIVTPCFSTAACWKDVLWYIHGPNDWLQVSIVFFAMGMRPNSWEPWWTDIDILAF